jgi:glycosyltransferase involved in cell wall biosynthesis
LDSRIRVFHKANGGLSSARNEGLDNAVGKYIIFLDSDDYWCSNDALKIIDDYIRKYQMDVYVFGVKKYFQYKNVYSKYQQPISDKETISQTQNTRFLMKHNLFDTSACNKVVRRTLIEENHMRFKLGQLSEDIEWSTKLVLYAKGIQVIPECFYIYRKENADSISSNISRKNLEHILAVISEYSHTDNELTLHFIANQYILWITNATRVPKSEINDLISQAKGYWYLLKYNLYPYVKTASKFKALGFNVLMCLLGAYRSVKQRWLR